MNILNKIKTNKDYKNKNFNILKKKKYTILFNNNKITVFDKNKKKMLVAKYIFFGIYENEKNIWIWSNIIQGASKNLINTIKDIKKKSYLFENDNNVDVQLIYQYLNNDILQVNKNKLKLLSDVLLYVSDSTMILTSLNEFGNIQYIGITNILERYI